MKYERSYRIPLCGPGMGDEARASLRTIYEESWQELGISPDPLAMQEILGISYEPAQERTIPLRNGRMTLSVAGDVLEVRVQGLVSAKAPPFETYAAPSSQREVPLEEYLNHAA